MKQKTIYLNSVLALLLITLCFSCIDNRSKYQDALQGSWIVYKSEPYQYFTDTTGLENGESRLVSSHSELAGYILTFNNDTVIGTHLNYGILNATQYQFNDSILKLNDSLQYKLIKLTDDTLQFLIFENSLITFIRIPHKKPNTVIIEESRFLNSSWHYQDSTQYQRIWFTNNEWGGANDSTYRCITLRYNNNLFYDSDLNHWRIMKLNNNDYLVKTIKQYYPILYDITKISGDTIHTRAIIEGNLRYPKFIKIQSLSRSEVEGRLNLLKQKKWKSKEFSFKDWYSKESKEYLGKRFEKLARHKESIQKGELSIEFTNDSLYATFVENKSLVDKWEISDDGEYIHVIRQDIMIGSIQIVKLEKNSLIIESKDLFRNMGSRIHLSLRYRFEFE